MNKELIKFIELCLADGVISDKERKVIFRKAKELGVPKDECEIILEGLILKNAQNNKQPTKQPKEVPIEKLNKKQGDKVDSRQPVKKDVAKRSFSLSEIKIPEVVRVILTILLGFSYFLFGIILISSSGPIVWGLIVVVAYLIFRFFKLQKDYFYFTICIFIIYFISKGDAYFII